MKVAQKVISIAAMVCLIMVMLLTSFQIAIYGDSEYKFYREDFEKYKVDEAMDMNMDDVMDVTTYMMDFLIGREDELSIETNVDGEYQDFFNDQDRFHMGEVRDLFLGGLALRNVLLVVAIILILVLIFAKMDWKHIIPWAYYRTLAVFAAIVAVLGIACAVNFDAAFTVFHQIFFDNSLWIFDPATDYMIRMLPEGFFLDMVIRIGVIFIVMLVVCWAICFVWNRVLKRRENG